MHGYHNGDVSLEEAWDLALFVESQVSKKTVLSGDYSKRINEILNHPNYSLYDRNPMEVYLESSESRFIVDNERIIPNRNGI